MNPLVNVFRSVNTLPHTFQIIATVAIGGSIFFVSWWLSTQGWLEMGATALTFFILQLMRMSGVSLVNKAPREFAKTASNIETARQEFGQWIANNKMLANCILALIFTGLFLLGRIAASGLMTMIASPLLAAALGLGIASIVISPVLFRGIVGSFKRDESQPTTRDEQSTAGA